MLARTLTRTVPLAAAFVLLASIPALAIPTTTVVPCGGDIQGAVSTANANPGPDTLKLASGCTYVLRSSATEDGLPAISSDLTIVGNGATILRNSTQQFRIMEIWAGVTVSISRVTVIGGEPPVAPSGAQGLDGGGILNAGTLTLKSVVVTGNVAGLGGPAVGSYGNTGGNGGGIYSSGTGTLKLIGSKITSNTAGRGSFGTQNGGSGGSGGGVANDGTATIRSSVIRSNIAGDAGSGGVNSGLSGFGGGLWNRYLSQAHISDSKIVSNSTGLSDFGPGTGGGIQNDGTHINPLRTTIKHNGPDNCAPSGSVSHCPN